MVFPAVGVTPSMAQPMSASGLVHGPQSPLIDTKRTCARIAISDATVLLTGETGTGKELFARFIHAHSPRAARAFVPVNCGAIPETLLESELFGYVKGAFTGAVSARKGRVAMADGGTLFLDEIGELPLSLQVKLLRLLQERSYEPIGSSESVPASFRLIAATNRDLAEEVRVGRFRSDLYYRLHVCPVRLPALRERRGDIAPLFQYFWTRRGESRQVDPTVLECLEAHPWMGNVRELENLVERVSVCAESDVIRMADLPIGIRAPHLGAIELEEIGYVPRLVESNGSHVQMDGGGAGSLAGFAADATALGAQAEANGGSMQPPLVPFPIDLPSLATIAAEARQAYLAAHQVSVSAPPSTGGTPTPILQFPIDLPTMLRELENRYINAALAQTGSNKKEAAKLLGMGRTTLVEKLRRRASDRVTAPPEE
jgi:sigma-54 specific flagellar transcriptional regulator A